MTDSQPDKPGSSASNSLDAFSRGLGRFFTTMGPGMIAFAALVMGLMALANTPREEEPQIVVPLADVFVKAPGLSAQQVERQIATPLENLLWQIDGVEYVYSMSRPGEAVVTVRFYVGEDREDSLVKIYNKVFSNQDVVPPDVRSWVVKPKEIDDVPIVAAMLWSRDPEQIGDHELRRIAEEAALDLQAIDNTNRVTVTGGRPREIRVELDPEALAARRTAPLDVAWALGVSNVHRKAGDLAQRDEQILVEAGDFFRSAEDVRNAIVNVVDGRPVYIKDVAQVSDGPAEPENYTWMAFGPAAEQSDPKTGFYPAVSISVAKRRGSNAVWVADDVVERLEELEEKMFPAGVEARVIRNYGETADQKVNDLVSSLLVAILTVVVFIGVVMGWRAALVVGLAVPICYGATLAFNLLTGYSINRVTLFALILALGLLVDDPITGIDNIDRYLRMGKHSKGKSILLAMQEIRGALVMSTLAIILSFIPMFFITGMMGPYMGPMAINVPLAVTMSTFVAFLITPWMARKFLRTNPNKPEYDVRRTPLYKLSNMAVRPLIQSPRRAWIFVGVVGVLFVFSLVLTAFRVVPLKLLPFDNKDEFQIVVDAPEGTTLERTDAALRAAADYLRTVPEVVEIAGFSGTASPIDFNGLVRRYYLRQQANAGDLRVTLLPRRQRTHQSHEIVLRIREDIDRIAEEYGLLLKLVEVPPGPPVISTITTEIYGEPETSYETILEGARRTAERLRQEALVVDIDTSIEDDQTTLVFETDKEKAALSGVSTQDIADTLALAVDGLESTRLQEPTEATPLPITLRLPLEKRSDPMELQTLRVIGRPGIVKERTGTGVDEAPQPVVPIGEVGEFRETVEEKTIYHKNLQRVAYVYAEMAGRAPADAIQDVVWDLYGWSEPRDEPRRVDSRNYLSPGAGIAWSLPDGVRAVWRGEGEWKITVRVFRDLGLAFGAALIGIFLVLILQTRSVPISLIIMLAIPLTMIGIMPGFWLLNVTGERLVNELPNPVFFTATAMIGMIALAGIVVRNSLILIEFIHQSLREGMDLQEALVQAGAIRMRPVLLTAGTTLLGNIVITLDPIFNGLAWSIIFGITASTIFTLGVIPVVYYLVYRNDEKNGLVRTDDVTFD